MVKYCDLFVSFFKVGTFTIGGGYAMIPLLQQEVVQRRGWLSEGDFVDYVALSQSLPGIFAVNMAACVGWQVRGVRGALAAVAGSVVMPVVIILCVAAGLGLFRGLPVVEHVFMGVRPCVVALICVPVVRMVRTAGVSWRTVWVPVVVLLLVAGGGVSPLWVVVGCIGIGVLWGYDRLRRGVQ